MPTVQTARRAAVAEKLSGVSSSPLSLPSLDAAYKIALEQCKLWLKLKNNLSLRSLRRRG